MDKILGRIWWQIAVPPGPNASRSCCSCLFR